MRSSVLLIFVALLVASVLADPVKPPKDGAWNTKNRVQRPQSRAAREVARAAGQEKQSLESRAPSSSCIQSFYTAANPVLSACKVNIDTASMYVINQIFKANPDYVRQACKPYYNPSTPVPSSTSFNPSASCKTAIANAGAAVNKACGKDANAAATALLADTYKRNKKFVEAQCAPYPTLPRFACPPTDDETASNEDAGFSCTPQWLLSPATTFPFCGYNGGAIPVSYADSPEQCQYDTTTGALISQPGTFTCCIRQAKVAGK